MPDRKKGDHKPASPDGEVIAKAERRLAEADKQRARIKADPEREVAREKGRVKRARKDNGFICLRSAIGGFYWVANDGKRVLRGENFKEAKGLQGGFISMMERAG